MFEEHGARVTFNESCTTKGKGTIVQCSVNGNWHYIRPDGADYDGMFFDDEYTITQTPSESAYSLTTRKSVDEILVFMIELAGDSNPNLTTYKSAVVFELYRLNHYAEATVALDFPDYDDDITVVTLDSERSEVTFWHVENAAELERRQAALDGWESGSCREPDRDGGYWPQDDGYGYPVYRVED